MEVTSAWMLIAVGLLLDAPMVITGGRRRWTFALALIGSVLVLFGSAVVWRHMGAFG